ncbi:MAG: hypothetical protein M3R03_04715 [Pseudomonadota bacterium]|nr:hypothetical protein [Pseudomonadota bacterium]
MNPKMAAAEADETVGSRGRAMMVSGIIYAAAQWLFLDTTSEPLGLFKSLCWVVITVALLLTLMLRGYLLMAPEVRERLEDEFTRLNRRRAALAGFLVSVLAGLVLYCVDLFEPLATGGAIQFTVAPGLSAALILFGWLERRGSDGE